MSDTTQKKTEIEMQFKKLTLKIELRKNRVEQQK